MLPFNIRSQLALSTSPALGKDVDRAILIESSPEAGLLRVVGVAGEGKPTRTGLVIARLLAVAPDQLEQIYIHLDGVDCGLKDLPALLCGFAAIEGVEVCGLVQERDMATAARVLVAQPSARTAVVKALLLAGERQHEYATLEHLLLALMEDQDALDVLAACSVNVEDLRNTVTEYVDKDLGALVTPVRDEPKPTAGFQRVLQRADIHVQSSGRDEVSGANVLVALFSERESHAVYFLQSHDMSRLDAVNFISHGIAKAGGRTERRTIRRAAAARPRGQRRRGGVEGTRPAEPRG